MFLQQSLHINNSISFATLSEILFPLTPGVQVFTKQSHDNIVEAYQIAKHIKVMASDVASIKANSAAAESEQMTL